MSQLSRDERVLHLQEELWLLGGLVEEILLESVDLLRQSKLEALEQLGEDLREIHRKRLSIEMGCMSLIATVTDYDCWHETEESVSVEAVLAVMRDNTRKMQQLLPDVVQAVAGRESCACHHAAAGAMITAPELIPYQIKRELSLFYGKYWRAD